MRVPSTPASTTIETLIEGVPQMGATTGPVALVTTDHTLVGGLHLSWWNLLSAS